MRRVLLPSLVFTCFAFASTLHAEDYYIPQVANGSFAGGSFRTTFVLLNSNNVAANVEIRLVKGANGQPFEVTIPGQGTSDQFKIALEAGASIILQTDGAGSLSVGAARVSTSARVGVSAVFTVFDAAGQFLTEAGVGSSAPLTDFMLPVDVTGTFNTGIALFNFGSTPASVALSLSNTSGQETGRTTLTLNPGGQNASFVSQLFSGTAGFRGTLRVTSSVAIAAVGLRQNETPLSYTSLPAVSRSAGRTSASLPQVANGTFSGGSFKTTFLLFNTSNSAASITLSLTKADGSAFAVNIPGTGNNSTFSVQLAAGASAFLQTDGSGPLTAGAASITSTQPIGAAAVFTVLDTQGRFQTEAGVGESAPLSALTLPVDVTGSFDTGVAFTNPNSGSITVNMKLLNAGGNVVATAAPLTLAAKNQTAKFVTELFQGTKDFRGSVAITVTGGPLAALTLRQHTGPLSYTTLPVAEGASQGTTPPVPSSVLLPLERSGFDGSNNATLNETLQTGFKIAGTISGSGKGQVVIARSGSSTYTGIIDRTTGRYAIAVPAGTYTLSVCFEPDGSITSAQIVSTYTDPSNVQVSGDTTRNITLPARQLFTVSGSVTGTASLIPLGWMMTFTAADNSTEGSFSVGIDGRYSGRLPNGNYVASFEVSIFGGVAGFEAVTVYNLGSATVNGSNITANFSLPTLAKLSGTVGIAGTAMLPPATMLTATDKSAQQPSAFACCTAPSTTLNMPDPTGMYQVSLAAGRTYDISVQVPVGSGQNIDGMAMYPTSGTSTSISSNATLNLTVPALPGQVIVTGKVSNSTGTGIRDVSVGAFSKDLSGAANVAYAGAAVTDAGGNYRLVLLKGVNYQITFTPPPPTP